MHLFPLVSVILPVYNCEKYIEKSIKSILDQSYKNFELIIINDCSNDSTDEIVKKFNDERIHYVINDINLKLIDTLNKGIKLSKGKYIARMDADDISHPDRLKQQVDFLEINTKVDVLGTAFEIIGNQNNDRFLNCKISYPKDSEKIAFNLIYNNVILHPSVMFRSAIFSKLKIYYSKKFIHAEEYYLWTQLILKSKFANLPNNLLKYRVHDSQISITNNQIQLTNSYEIQYLYLQSLGMDVSLNETKLFVDFLQGKKINDIEIFSVLNIISVFENMLKKTNIIDQKYALNEINKNLKNTILNCKILKIKLLKSTEILRFFQGFTTKQKIALLLKLRF